jgi:hypothetical protein
MTKRKGPRTKVHVSVAVQHCQFQWPTARRCWLCRKLVPANTFHECWKGRDR